MKARNRLNNNNDDDFWGLSPQGYRFWLQPRIYNLLLFRLTAHTERKINTGVTELMEKAPKALLLPKLFANFHCPFAHVLPCDSCDKCAVCSAWIDVVVVKANDLWWFYNACRMRQWIFLPVGTWNNETPRRSLLSSETRSTDSVRAGFIEDFKMTDGAFALFWIAPRWLRGFTLIIKSFGSFQSFRRRPALCGVFKIMTIIKK